MLAELSQQAQQSPRRRANHNLHDELNDPIQRLAIAMEPDTLVLENPASTWHAVLSLDQGGIIFEVKQGPYMPVGEADQAPWAAGRLAEELNAWYANARVGDCFA